MTTTTETQPQSGAAQAPTRKGSIIVNWLTSTDHKTIGYMYLITSFAFFLFGGVLRS